MAGLLEELFPEYRDTLKGAARGAYPPLWAAGMLDLPFDVLGMTGMPVPERPVSKAVTKMFNLPGEPTTGAGQVAEMATGIGVPLAASLRASKALKVRGPERFLDKGQELGDPALMSWKGTFLRNPETSAKTMRFYNDQETKAKNIIQGLLPDAQTLDSKPELGNRAMAFFNQYMDEVRRGIDNDVNDAFTRALGNGNNLQELPPDPALVRQIDDWFNTRIGARTGGQHFTADEQLLMDTYTQLVRELESPMSLEMMKDTLAKSVKDRIPSWRAMDNFNPHRKPSGLEVELERMTNLWENQRLQAAATHFGGSYNDLVLARSRAREAFQTKQAIADHSLTKLFRSTDPDKIATALTKLGPNTLDIFTRNIGDPEVVNAVRKSLFDEVFSKGKRSNSAIETDYDFRKFVTELDNMKNNPNKQHLYNFLRPEDPAQAAEWDSRIELLRRGMSTFGGNTPTDSGIAGTAGAIAGALAGGSVGHPIAGSVLGRKVFDAGRAALGKNSLWDDLYGPPVLTGGAREPLGAAVTGAAAVATTRPMNYLEKGLVGPAAVPAQPQDPRVAQIPTQTGLVAGPQGASPLQGQSSMATPPTPEIDPNDLNWDATNSDNDIDPKDLKW